jgi:exosortase/archaeosortase family protein
VAIIANALRVSGTGLLGYYIGQRFTVGYWHLLEGWFVFVVAFMLLSLELKLIERLHRRVAKAS